MRQASYTLALVLAFASAREAWGTTEMLKTSAGSPAHWVHGQISVGLDGAAASRTLMSADVQRAIEHASLAWNSVHAGQPRLRFAAGEKPDVTLRFCRDQWHGDNIDLGNTQFAASLRDGTVTAATIELNECDHEFAPPGKPSPGRLDLQAILTHELGHALGLGHSTNPGSVMFPSGSGARPSRPHREDATTLTLVYFGRTFEPDTFPTVVDHEPPAREESPYPPPPAPSLAASPVYPAPKQQATAVHLKEGAGAFAPTDSVSVLTLTTREGRSVMVYTCDPTLLPPITAAPQAQMPKRPRGHPERLRIR